jgi:hypothetical protein
MSLLSTPKILTFPPESLCIRARWIMTCMLVSDIFPNHCSQSLTSASFPISALTKAWEERNNILSIADRNIHLTPTFCHVTQTRIYIDLLLCYSCILLAIPVGAFQKQPINFFASILQFATNSCQNNRSCLLKRCTIQLQHFS